MIRFRIRWQIICLSFLGMCTLISFYIVSEVSNGCEACEKSQVISCNATAVKRGADLPTLYLITPTYARPTQKAELTRLSHTLMHVPQLHWIVVEDGNTNTALIGQLLQRSGLIYTHLNVETPDKFKIKDNQPKWSKPKGVWQRNLGLDWLRRNKNQSSGVVYFADDDNTYDLQLFEEMRSTKRVSVWPVGLVGGLKWEGPRISEGRIVSWQTLWKPERPFAIDMAGFAINLRLILNSPRAKFSEKRPRGYVETSLLEQLVTPAQLEPKGDGKILVWHTRTEKPKLYSDDYIKSLNFDPKEMKSDVEV